MHSRASLQIFQLAAKRLVFRCAPVNKNAQDSALPDLEIPVYEIPVYEIPDYKLDIRLGLIISPIDTLNC